MQEGIEKSVSGNARGRLLQAIFGKEGTMRMDCNLHSWISRLLHVRSSKHISWVNPARFRKRCIRERKSRYRRMGTTNPPEEESDFPSSRTLRGAASLVIFNAL